MTAFLVGLILAVGGLMAAVALRRRRAHAVASCAVALCGLLIALGAAVVAGPTGQPFPEVSLEQTIREMRLAGWEVDCTSGACRGHFQTVGVRYDIVIRRVGRNGIGEFTITARTDGFVTRPGVLRPFEYPVILAGARDGDPAIQRLRRALRTGEAPASWQTQRVHFRLEGPSCDIRRPLDCRLTIAPAI